MRERRRSRLFVVAGARFFNLVTQRSALKRRVRGSTHSPTNPFAASTNRSCLCQASSLQITAKQRS